MNNLLPVKEKTFYEFVEKHAVSFEGNGFMGMDYFDAERNVIAQWTHGQFFNEYYAAVSSNYLTADLVGPMLGY